MNTKTKNYEIDMIHGPLLGKIVFYTLPLIFSSVLQLLFNAADIIVVGQFATAQSVAAVSSVSSLINLLISMFLGIGTGVNVMVAHYFATHNDKDVSETVHTAIEASIIGGIFLGIAGIIFTRPLLILMDTPEDVIDLAATYLRIYFISMPANIFYNTGSAILRAIGDTRRPLFFLTIAGIINVILNLVTVIYFHMDVAGVALATSISLIVSALLVLNCLRKSDASYRFELKKMHITGDKLKRILRIGIPSGLQGTVFSVSNVIIQSSINSFGSLAMAGNGAASNIEGFIYVAMSAVYYACVTFTSQNYGAGDMKRVKRVALTCQGLVTCVGLALGALAYVFARPLLGIYVSDAESIEVGMTRLSVICLTYFLCGNMDTLCGSIRGLGSAVVPMIVSLLGACGLRIVLVYTVFRMPAYHSLRTLFIFYPVSWIVTALAHLVFFIYLFRKVSRKLNEAKMMNTQKDTPVS